MIIVDDHLALLALAGRLPDLPNTEGPVATTYAFQFRMVRALTDSTQSGTLSGRLADPAAALRRATQPPAHRLVVLDPRASLGQAVDVATRHPANLLLAELIGAAQHHQAAVRLTPANVGKSWPGVLAAEGIDFGTVDA
ncbi:MAG TPA: hypothetical protein VIJ60_12375 [Acidimicrobiales bacterium]